MKIDILTKEYFENPDIHKVTKLYHDIYLKFYFTERIVII